MGWWRGPGRLLGRVREAKGSAAWGVVRTLGAGGGWRCRLKAVLRSLVFSSCFVSRRMTCSVLGSKTSQDSCVFPPCCLGAFPVLGGQLSWLCIPFLWGGGIDSWTTRGVGKPKESLLGGGGDVEKELEQPTAHSGLSLEYTRVAWCLARTAIAWESMGKLLPRSRGTPFMSELCP